MKLPVVWKQVSDATTAISAASQQALLWAGMSEKVLWSSTSSSQNAKVSVSFLSQDPRDSSVHSSCPSSGQPLIPLPFADTHGLSKAHLFCSHVSSMPPSKPCSLLPFKKSLLGGGGMLLAELLTQLPPRLRPSS